MTPMADERFVQPPLHDLIVSPVMTTNEVAAVLGISASSVYRLAATGEIPSFRIGSSYRFYREEIERWRTTRKTE
jgi:excisionase family DNA binding protein